jgi:hypothetical protein
VIQPYLGVLARANPKPRALLARCAWHRCAFLRDVGVVKSVRDIPNLLLRHLLGARAETEMGASLTGLAWRRRTRDDRGTAVQA